MLTHGLFKHTFLMRTETVPDVNGKQTAKFCSGDYPTAMKNAELFGLFCPIEKEN